MNDEVGVYDKGYFYNPPESEDPGPINYEDARAAHQKVGAEIVDSLKGVVDEELTLTILATSKGVSLNVYEPYNKEEFSKTAYIDRDTMIKLGLDVNDIIEIETNYGARTVANVSSLHPEDEGKNMIRINAAVAMSITMIRNTRLDLERHEIVTVRKAEQLHLRNL